MRDLTFRPPRRGDPVGTGLGRRDNGCDSREPRIRGTRGRPGLGPYSRRERVGTGDRRPGATLAGQTVAPCRRSPGVAVRSWELYL